MCKILNKHLYCTWSRFAIAKFARSNKSIFRLFAWMNALYLHKPKTVDGLSVWRFCIWFQSCTSTCKTFATWKFSMAHSEVSALDYMNWTQAYLFLPHDVKLFFPSGCLMFSFFFKESDQNLNTGSTAQKMKFSIKDFFSKCDQICSKLWIWSHLVSFFMQYIFYYKNQLNHRK